MKKTLFFLFLFGLLITCIQHFVHADLIICTAQYDPVCGVSNNVYKTYGNSCEASKVQAQILFKGECTSQEALIAQSFAHKPSQYQTISWILLPKIIAILNTYPNLEAKKNFINEIKILITKFQDRYKGTAKESVVNLISQVFTDNEHLLY